jgi:hypothetical protein
MSSYGHPREDGPRRLNVGRPDLGPRVFITRSEIDKLDQAPNDRGPLRQFTRGIHRTGTKGSNPVPSSKESANPRSLSGDPVSHSLAALIRSRSDGMERRPGVPRHRPGELDASRRAGARAEPTDHRTPVGRLRDQFWRTDFVRPSAPRGCASTPSANSWSQRRRASKRRCCGWSGEADMALRHRPPKTGDLLPLQE